VRDGLADHGEGCYGGRGGKSMEAVDMKAVEVSEPAGRK
jgi:hypothetical protein